MCWHADEPFLTSAALGETAAGARNLPGFLCSQLVPGPVLVLGCSEVVLRAARAHDVIALDWSSRRLAALESVSRERGVTVRTICRDPERQELGIGRRSVRNVVCLDGLDRFRDDVGVLERLQAVLAPEGRLVVRVRSGDWVREQGARLTTVPRRYDPVSLRESLEEAGLRTLRLRHWNALGVPAALCDRVLRKTDRSPTEEHHWWDGALDAWYRQVESRVGFPTGVSLVAVATPYLEKSRVRRDVRAAIPARRRAREAYTPTACAR
ncbi:MAG: class I SAM-dependent methyltransferase [Gemmatimonadetes bacterium]|nr:class I SAM-dependent methyltransferase [Gemmatimonadota bacterium]